MICAKICRWAAKCFITLSSSPPSSSPSRFIRLMKRVSSLIPFSLIKFQMIHARKFAYPERFELGCNKFMFCENWSHKSDIQMITRNCRQQRRMSHISYEIYYNRRQNVVARRHSRETLNNFELRSGLSIDGLLWRYDDNILDVQRVVVSHSFAACTKCNDKHFRVIRLHDRWHGDRGRKTTTKNTNCICNTPCVFGFYFFAVFFRCSPYVIKH